MSAGDRANFSGDLEVTAPTGGVTRGSIYTIEDKQVVAREDADAAASFKAAFQGAVTVTKATGTGKVFAVGDEVFALSNVADLTGTGAVLIGYAIAAAGASDATVDVELVGLPPTAS